MVDWRKSSYTGRENCVEVAFFGHGVGVRDSRHPEGGRITTSLEAWVALLNVVVEGGW